MSDTKRAMVFIDFDNINIPARQNGIKYINFNGLRNKLCEGHRAVGCTVYLPSKMSSLVSQIQKSGLEVQLVSPNKSVDGRLIFDLLTNAHDDRFDIAIIASGDRDFVPVLQRVKSLKKEVHIASFRSNLAHALTSTADNIIYLDDYKKEFSFDLNGYTCSNCGVAFEVPFKIYGPTPLCPDCKRKSK